MIGSLFSGIGGLELGLERAGLGPVRWQVEIDPFCRSVLAKHWPTVERFNDVTQPRRYPKVDLICGGFPCQDVSSAGGRRGIGGSRSGLWRHFAAVVDQVKPRVVVVENVASGKAAWLPTVRRDLHVLGYDSTASLRAIVEAIREVLDLPPLYESDRKLTVERFTPARTFYWPKAHGYGSAAEDGRCHRRGGAE